MWLRYHEQAERTGARLVHSCGFDSIPYDLGALFTVEQLPEGVPIALEGFVRVGGDVLRRHVPLGDPHHGAAAPGARGARASAAARAAARRAAGPRVAGRPHDDAEAGGWVVPFPTIDPQTVLRSARALDRYGPDFSYGHYLVVKRCDCASALVGGAGAVVALAQLRRRASCCCKLKDPGEGPSPSERAERLVQGPVGRRGRRPAGRHRGLRRRPGLRRDLEDARRVGALPRARRAPGDAPGQLTPAVAMGQALIDRLARRDRLRGRRG